MNGHSGRQATASNRRYPRPAAFSKVCGHLGEQSPGVVPSLTAERTGNCRNIAIHWQSGFWVQTPVSVEKLWICSDAFLLLPDWLSASMFLHARSMQSQIPALAYRWGIAPAVAGSAPLPPWRLALTASSVLSGHCPASF